MQTVEVSPSPSIVISFYQINYVHKVQVFSDHITHLHYWNLLPKQEDTQQTCSELNGIDALVRPN